MRNGEKIESLKADTNSAKEDLIRIIDELYEVGGIREAKSLETIVIKLESWQNK